MGDVTFAVDSQDFAVFAYYDGGIVKFAVWVLLKDGRDYYDFMFFRQCRERPCGFSGYSLRQRLCSYFLFLGKILCSVEFLEANYLCASGCCFLDFTCGFSHVLRYIVGDACLD